MIKDCTFKNIKLATINVGTYKGKEEEIVGMMMERRVDVVGMSEMRVEGEENGRDLGGGYVLAYRGIDAGIRKHGVGFIFGPKIAPFIQEVRGISERLIVGTFKIKKKKYRLYQVYAPQQGHPEEEKEGFMDLLEESVEGGDVDNMVHLLMGDFNARVGKRRSEVERILGTHGEDERNPEGERLVDFCMRRSLKIMNGFFKHRESHKFTRYRWNKNTESFDQKSIIDYFIVSDYRMVENVKVLPGVSFDSDHRVVVARLRVQEAKWQVGEKRKVIRVEALKEQGKREEYVEKIKEKLTDVQEINMNLQETIGKAAEETLGVRWFGGTRKKHTMWWNEEVKKAVSEKNKKMRRWLKGRTEQRRAEYVIARNRAEIVKREAKRSVMESMAEELREDVEGGKKKIFKLAKTYKKSKKKLYSIKNKDGEVLTEQVEVNERWAEYFEELLNAEEEGNGEEEQYERDELEEENPITREEYEEAMSKMKNGKAPGEDGIAIELIKEGGEELKGKIVELFNKCWMEGVVPDRWGKIVILPIYKGKGDTGECGNYRGIALLDHIAKVYERILEKRLREAIEMQLGEEQYGYRRGRSTSDMLFALRIVLEKSWEFNKTAYIAFLDLRKAFDSVPRGRLWRMLGEVYGVEERLRRAIKSLYSICECNVRTGCRNEKWFEVGTGVRQGSVLSPLLFIAYLDVVIKNVKEEFPNLDGDIMVYADDLACWSGREEVLGRLMESFARNLRGVGMEMNTEKTVVMVVGRDDEREMEVHIGEERLKNVDQFVYLGGVFTSKGGCIQEVEARMEKYGRTVRALYPIMKDRVMDIRVKKIIFDSILVPTLTYGSETWSITTREEKRIEAAEMRVLRMIVGKTRRDRVRNEWVRERIGVVPVINRMDSARLRWWGHVERMSEERVARRRWRWRVDGVRPRGRPRVRWADCVERALRRHGLPEMRQLVEDGVIMERATWKMMLSPLTGRRPT